MEHGVTAQTWLALAAILLAGKLGGEGALRLRQPAVLGELAIGVLLGNLHIPGLREVAHGEELGFAAELGVMLLLFQVGLESSVREMTQVAPRAGAVAVLGVIFPSVLGMGASKLLLPDAPMPVHIFIGATMCATSVGVTASVLKDAAVLATEEARIILGAAVIDDVLGLLVLAIVSAVAMTGGEIPDLWTIARITGTAFGFVVGSLVIGLWAFRRVYRVAAVLRAPHVLGAISISACLLLAGMSATAGLAAIVGAYAAGLLLDDVSVRPFSDETQTGVHKVETFVAPIVAVFAPVFFVRTGMNVELSGLGGPTLVLSVVLVVTAVAGKLVSGFGVRGGGTDRLTIGLGMLPRGEVGLIFADAGARLAPGGTPLLSPAVYAALVMAVFATTLLAPPALAARIRTRQRQAAARVAATVEAALAGTDTKILGEQTETAPQETA
jgi:Kef-type K+ transport system membrane component KefB